MTLEQQANQALNPASIEVEALERLLGFKPGQIQRHVEDGAPTNADGTMNLIHYAAWLNCDKESDDEQQFA